MKQRRLATTEDRVLVGVLVFLFLVALGIPVFEEITGKVVPPSWNTPVILLALYAIVRLVGPVPQIRSDVRYLREVADVRVQRMANIKDFYDNLSKAVDSANATLDLTHIRDTPPADFGDSAGAFFNKLVDWCSIEGRSIRRIICVRTPAMYLWAEQLARDIEHLPQFSIRVIDWSPSAPAMNLAVIDGKATYLALTGPTLERTKGLGIEDSTATQYFSDYYENLWLSSVSLPQWLKDNTYEG